MILSFHSILNRERVRGKFVMRSATINVTNIMRCHAQEDPNPTERRANWCCAMVVLLAKERHPCEGVGPATLEIPPMAGLDSRPAAGA